MVWPVSSWPVIQGIWAFLYRKAIQINTCFHEKRLVTFSFFSLFFQSRQARSESDPAGSLSVSAADGIACCLCTLGGGS